MMNVLKKNLPKNWAGAFRTIWDTYHVMPVSKRRHLGAHSAR